MGQIITKNEAKNIVEKLKKEGIIARKYFYPLINEFECYLGYGKNITGTTSVALEEERVKKIKGWKKAVRYAFDWAKDEE